MSISYMTLNKSYTGLSFTFYFPLPHFADFHRSLPTSHALLIFADFGLSAMHDSPTWLETQCGTKGYMAPEILGKSPYKGPVADIWSMGVVLFIMLTGFPPFQIAKKGDWWFDRITKSQYKYFWKAHLRNCNVSELAQGTFICII